MAEERGALTFTIDVKDAIGIRDELERLADIEKRYDYAESAAEDRRLD